MMGIELSYSRYNLKQENNYLIVTLYFSEKVFEIIKNASTNVIQPLFNKAVFEHQFARYNFSELNWDGRLIKNENEFSLTKYYNLMTFVD